MKTTILLFGQLKDIVGADQVELEGITDTDSLRQKLIREFPSLANIKFALSFNKKIITVNETVQPGSEIALLPPFSGG